LDLSEQAAGWTSVGSASDERKRFLCLPTFIKGLALPYGAFDRITKVDLGAIVENKRLSEALELCRAMPAEPPPKLRRRKAPTRTAQVDHRLGAV
jgi:hypothetical protein